MCDDLPFINTVLKTLKPSKKNVSIPRMDEKKLHSQEFLLKGITENTRCKLLQKRSAGKTTGFQTLVVTSAIKKVFSQNLTSAFFKYL